MHRTVGSGYGESGTMPGTMAIIADRLARGDRRDGYHVSLAIDGGGMRGVVSGAMLIALRDIGISCVFDDFVGVSAAGINLAHWGQGRSWDALAMYYDYLPHHFFRSPRSEPYRPMLKMEYLDQLFSVHFPLDPALIREFTQRPAYTFAVNIDRQEIEVFDITDPKTDIVNALKASSWLPLLSGGPMKWNGSKYVDGGILAAHPIYTAIGRGATHILALSPAADVGDTVSAKRSRPLLAGLLDRWSRGLGRKYLASRVRWDSDRRLIDASGGTAPVDGVEIARIVPAVGSHRVSRLTQDLGTLLAGARVGYSTILESFGKGTDSPLPFIVGGPQ